MTKRQFNVGFGTWIDLENTEREPFCVDLSLMATPLDKCEWIKLDAIKKTKLKKLQVLHYDQAPCITPNLGFGVRLVHTEHLQSLLSEGKKLDEHPDNFLSQDIFDISHIFDNATRQIAQINELTIPLTSLLSRFMESRAFIILRFVPEREYLTVHLSEHRSYDKRDSYEIVNAYGLVTLADLNKPVVRKAAYELFLAIELKLSQIIESHYTDPYDWIQLLNDDAQAQALGYWDLSRRRDLDLSPIASVTFSQLLQVAGRSKEIIKRMKYKSKSEFSSHTGSMPLVRNRIMHPVRPLVLSYDDFKKLKETIDSAINLLSRCDKLITLLNDSDTL